MIGTYIVKVGKHMIRADKIVAVEQGRFITNMNSSVQGGHMCAIIYLEGGHAINTTEDFEKVLKHWQTSIASIEVLNT